MLLFLLILYVRKPCSWECWLHFKRGKAFGVSLAVLITLHACSFTEFLWEAGETLYLGQVRLNVPELFFSTATVEDTVRGSLKWSRDFLLSLALTVMNLYFFHWKILFVEQSSSVHHHCLVLSHWFQDMKFSFCKDLGDCLGVEQGTRGPVIC